MDLDINPQGAMSQFFNALIIRQLQERYCCAPLWEGDVTYDRDTGGHARLVQRDGGLVKLWIHPELRGGVLTIPSARYAAGADISLGTGASPSVLSVANCETWMKVLEYTDANIEATPFALLCVALLSLFRDEDNNPPKFCWESCGPGGVFGKKVVELGYHHVYDRGDDLPYKGPRWVPKDPGWNSSISNNKRDMLEAYRGGLAGHEYINCCYEALEECLSFRWTKDGRTIEHAAQEGQDPANARVNHGDHVIADGLCYKMMRAQKLSRRKEPPKPPTTNSLAGRRLHNEQMRREEEAWV